jgi:hypothetical protein
MLGSDRDNGFRQVLGAAVVDVWSDLPQEIQEKLFEHAVASGQRSDRGESLREELAKYLHDHHERTRAALQR